MRVKKMNRPKTTTSLRCCAPADLLLLLEGAGLTLEKAEVKGELLDLSAD
jgi:hypothetical protein